jgi:hypothetical protein
MTYLTGVYNQAELAEYDRLRAHGVVLNGGFTPIKKSSGCVMHIYLGTVLACTVWLRQWDGAVISA